MLERLRNLSRKAKAGIAGGLALLVAAGVGLGVWQPWNQKEEPDPPADIQQEPSLPADEPQAKPENKLSIQVNGEKVECTLYEGAGWSIYVPENWSTEKLGDNGGLFSAGDGGQLSVRFEAGSDYMGNFVNLSNTGNDRMLQFYSGIGEGSPVVEGSAPKTKWEQYRKLFVAMARTLTVGDEKPFAESYIIPEEPDWQKADGMTVLFLDKDGYVVDDEAQKAVESYMLSWPETDREIYTGQYRINTLEWASSYTGLTKNGYVDVFRADVQYRVREGAAAPEGAVNSWASVGDSVYLAVAHDGGSVSKTTGIATGLEKGWAGFASEIM